MGIRLNEAGYYDLRKHVGHPIILVGYGRDEDEDFANVAIECVDCGEVILDFEQPFFDELDDGTLVCCECNCDAYVDDHETEGDGGIYCSNEQCENSKPDWGSIGEPS